MRPLMVIGVLLIVFGIAALMFQGITYYTTERVVDAGPFKVDVQKPHTIVLHPIVGIVSVIGGIVMVVAGRPVRARLTATDSRIATKGRGLRKVARGPCFFRGNCTFSLRFATGPYAKYASQDSQLAQTRSRGVG